MMPLQCSTLPLFQPLYFFTFFPPWGRPCTGPNIGKISLFALWRTLRWFHLVFAAMTAVALQVVLVVGGAGSGPSCRRFSAAFLKH